jgi:hypothetical protein
MGPQPPARKTGYFQRLRTTKPKNRTGIGAHPGRQNARISAAGKGYVRRSEITLTKTLIVAALNEHDSAALEMLLIRKQLRNVDGGEKPRDFGDEDAGF